MKKTAIIYILAITTLFSYLCYTPPLSAQDIDIKVNSKWMYKCS